MKRILFITAMALTMTLGTKAQNITYPNIVQFAVQKTVAGARTVAGRLGYTVGYTSTSGEYQVGTFTWGACTCRRGEVSIKDGQAWAYINVAYNQEFGTVIWTFPNKEVFAQLMKEMDSNGWKYASDTRMDDGTAKIYRKEGSEDYFSIIEYSNGTYDFSFNWFVSGQGDSDGEVYIK